MSKGLIAEAALNEKKFKIYSANKAVRNEILSLFDAFDNVA
jgi:hypothetical protein